MKILIVLLSLFLVPSLLAARTVNLAWDQVPEADSYALYRCDMVSGEWDDLYLIAIIPVFELTDPTLPGYTDDAAIDNASHCYQVYSVLNGIYSQTGSNFDESRLPGDFPNPNFPAPATGLQAQ